MGLKFVERRTRYKVRDYIKGNYEDFFKSWESAVEYAMEIHEKTDRDQIIITKSEDTMWIMDDKFDTWVEDEFDIIAKKRD